nr:MAG TPA: hypothetical protein [Caudoviricetes sp.]
MRLPAERRGGLNQPKGYLKIQVARQIQEQDKWQKPKR